MTKLPHGFLKEDILEALSLEVERALAASVFRCRTNVNNSTRDFDGVSGNSLQDTDEYPAINGFAHNDSLLKALKYISGNEELKPGVHDFLYPAHVNRTIGKNSHHGWHLDDAGFKFVVVTNWEVDVEEEENGGSVGWIPHYVADEDRKNSLAQRHISISPEFAAAYQQGCDYETILKKKVPTQYIKQLNFVAGDCYFMEGRSVCHTVNSLTSEKTVRCSACFSFDDVHDQSNYEASASLVYHD